MNQRLAMTEFYVRQMLGWPGAVALVLAVAALLLTYALDQQDQDERRLRATLREARQQAEVMRQTASQPVVLARADTALVKRAGIPDALDELHRLAELLKLELPQAQYALLNGSATEPSVYEITLPFKARYSTVKPLLMMALNTIPGLAIREVSFRRPIPEVFDLDVTVRLALFLQDEDR